MSTSYPLALPSLSLTIAGTDRTAEVLARTLVIHSIAGAQVDTCDFSLKSPESWRGTATSKPTVGQEVVVQLKTGSGAFARVFGGTVQSSRDVRVGFKTVRWDVSCTDFTELLTRTLVNRTYQGLTAGQIVTDILRRYAPTVSASGVQATTESIVAITFANRTPTDCLTELAQLAGYEWYVTPDKVLRFYAAGTYVSANTITDTSENFTNLAIEPQLQQVRNRVVVQGGTTESALITEQWDQSDSDTSWKLSRGNVIMTLSSGLGYPTQAMTIDGLAQPLQKAPFDENLWAGGFLLDDPGERGGRAIVRKAFDTDTPANGSRIEFRYRERIPIAVVRESQASMLTVARLASEDYETVVSGSGPLHWWRLNDPSATFPANAVNRGVSRKYASSAYYLTLYSGSLQPGVEGALIGDQDPAVEFDGTDGRLVCASGLRISETAYTLEAWVQVPGQPNRGIISNYRDSALLGGVVLYTAPNGDYTLTHRSAATIETLVPDASAAPTGGDYDHVVATYQINGAWLYVNGQLVASGTLVRPKTTELVDGVEIGSYDYQNVAHNFSGRIDEAAIYDRGLSPTEICQHYHAGKWAGIREAVISDPNLGSLDRARKAGDAALARWASVVTDVRFESYVPGWQIGDTVTVNVTSAGTGRNYNGDALIQEVDYLWVGAQRVLYRVHCVGTRYNWLDWQRDLAAPKPEPQDGTPLSIVTTVEATALLIPAVPLATSNSLPFVVKPDWGTITLGGSPPQTYIKCEMWQIPSTGRGTF